MDELLKKISSYNLFNYLLPGVIFVVLAGQYTEYNFVQSDIIVGAFLYYFLGLVISRVGSLVIEPVLKWLSFVKFADYEKFFLASKKDVKLEILSEANNSYRTFISLIILLLILKIFEKIKSAFPIIEAWSGHSAILFLLVLFIFSYRKQTGYIKSRIDHAKSGKNRISRKK